MIVKINQWIEDIQKGNVFNNNIIFFSNFYMQYKIYILKYIFSSIFFSDPIFKLLKVSLLFTRHRHRDKIDKSSSSQDVKDRNGSVERFTQKSSQDREKHKKSKKKKDNKDKRDNSRTDENRDKKEEGKDKRESEKEKQEETKERTESTKNKKENIKERRNDTLEIEVEGKDKKDKDKWKEKVLLKSNSWAEVRKSGLTLDDIIYLRRRDNAERSNIKIR